MSKKIKLLIVIIFLGIGLSFCNEANANSITMDDITYEYENYNDKNKGSFYEKISLRLRFH